MAKVAPNEAQEGLQGSEATTFPHILDRCLASAVLAIDERQRITAFSPEAERLLQLTARQTLEQPIDVLPTPLRELVQKTFLTGEPFLDEHILVPVPGESELTVRVSTTATRGAGE